MNEPTKYPEGSLQVDKDFGSTGLWIRQDGYWANCRYAHHNIPDWLVRRFDYWSAWYETYHPWEGEELDDTFEPYGLSLAIDLKLFLGAEHHVFFRGTEIQPVPFDPDNLPK